MQQPEISIHPLIGRLRNNTDLINLSDSSEQQSMDLMEEMELFQMNTALVKRNIEYDCLVQRCRLGEQQQLDEIVALIVETISIERENITISGVKYPYQFVKSRLLLLEESHIEYVLDCLHENTREVKNIKAYLLTCLMNSITTIGNYYQAKVKGKNSYKVGKQSYKELKSQGSGLSNIEITDGNIKSFERVAKKYRLDFALKKDSSTKPPTYYVFFKGQDTEMMNLAFKKYLGVQMNKKDKPSIMKKLMHFKDAVSKGKNRERAREQQKDRGQSL